MISAGMAHEFMNTYDRLESPVSTSEPVCSSGNCTVSPNLSSPMIASAGITRERLESFDRPIKVEPEDYPDKRDALIGEFQNYLGILKVHPSHHEADSSDSGRGSVTLLGGRTVLEQEVPVVEHGCCRPCTQAQTCRRARRRRLASCRRAPRIIWGTCWGTRGITRSSPSCRTLWRRAQRLPRAGSSQATGGALLA